VFRSESLPTLPVAHKTSECISFFHNGIDQWNEWKGEKFLIHWRFFISAELIHFQVSLYKRTIQCKNVLAPVKMSMCWASNSKPCKIEKYWSPSTFRLYPIPWYGWYMWRNISSVRYEVVTSTSWIVCINRLTIIIIKNIDRVFSSNNNICVENSLSSW